MLLSEAGFLNGNDLIWDGTFSWCLNLDLFSQQYNIVIKFEEGDTVLTYTIATILLKGKTTPSYKKMLDALNGLYQEAGHEGDFKPKSVRLDHEKAVVNTIRNRWCNGEEDDPLVVTCNFHFLSLQRKRFANIDQFYFKETSPIHAAWQMVKGLCYVDWHADIWDQSVNPPVNGMVQHFFEVFPQCAPDLPATKQRKFQAYCVYLKKEFFGKPKYGFNLNDHYNMYKSGISDLTSNGVETRNCGFNKDSHSGKKDLESVCNFMVDHKTECYEDKLYKCTNGQYGGRFNPRRKEVIEKWAKQREAFFEFDSLPSQMQKERLLEYLQAIGTANPFE